MCHFGPENNPLPRKFILNLVLNKIYIQTKGNVNYGSCPYCSENGPCLSNTPHFSLAHKTACARFFKHLKAQNLLHVEMAVSVVLYTSCGNMNPDF